MTISFHNLRKVFADGTVALDDLSLSFEAGEFLVLLGPSGSGKSTACRILAGLEVPSAGRVEVDGKDVTGLPPRDRKMSMVFQNYALYPHKNVYDNIAYPLRVRGKNRAFIDRAVREVAEMLGIAGLLERRPRQLSGGEAQRVAVARAIVWQPEICLMDEPLSNLDALLRLRTRAELKRIHRDLGKTFVFVTHDQEEAMSLGTRIAVLERGKLVQLDTPRAIYHRPATRFVAEFIGRPAMNTIDGVIARDGERVVFRSGKLEVPFGRAPAGVPDDGPVVLGIRPEAIEVADGPGEDTVTMTLDVIETVEPDILLTVVRDEISMMVRCMPGARGVAEEELAARQVNTPIHLRMPPGALHFFAGADGRRLS